MSSLSTLPKGDSAWLLRKSIQRIMQQVSVLETNIGSSTTGNSADTQVIFNDAGTLRGDTGLTYDKSADRLSFGAGICYGLLTTASATITGALTVDTTTLVVNPAGYPDRVGIGTATPDSLLQMAGAGTINWKLSNTSDSVTVGAYAGTTTGTTGTVSNHPFFLFTNNTERYRIASDGVATWSNVGGVAGTAMTLNSTGLGVGTSPSSNCKLSVNGGVFLDRGGTGGASQLLVSLAASSGGNFGQISNTGTRWALGYGSTLTTVGTEALIWDSSGNVGIGVTPKSWASGYRALQLGIYSALTDAQSGATYLTNNAYFDSVDSRWEYITNNRVVRYDQDTADGGHKWYSAAAGAVNAAIAWGNPLMTLDASGNLLVGTTNSVVWNTTNQGCVISGNAIQASRSGDTVLLLNRIGSNGKIAVFARQGLEVGDISVTTTGTTFNSTSDYRLKEDVQPLVGGLARVSALKPSIYKWKSNGSSGEGFLAHELAEVVPAAVSGEKDAVNEDGTIKAQSIDMSRVVPILVAAIQELTARVQTLETR